MNLFLEGWGHLATAQMPLKWDSVDPFHIITTGGRYSANALSASSLSATAGTLKQLSPGTPFEGLCGYHVNYSSLGLGGGGFNFFTEFAVWNGTTPLLTFVIMDSASGNGTMRVFRGSYTGTVLGTTADPVVTVGSHKNVQIRWLIDPTNGEIEIRRENASGVQEVALLLTGINTGSTPWNRVGFWPGTNEFFSHIWVNDRSGTRNTYFEPVSARVLTGLPDANGTVAWTPSTGSNFAAVDDASPNADTDYVAAGAAALRDRYSLTPLSTFDHVHAVQLNVIARKLSSGFSPTLSGLAVQSGADYVAAAQAVPLPYTDLRTNWDENPATGNEWTIAEINAGEFGQERAA